MAILTNSLTYDLATVIVSLICVGIAYYKWCFTYWKRRGVPQYPGTIPFGSVEKMIKQESSPGQQFHEFYKSFTSEGHKHGGVYNFFNPIYVPCDLDIIKHILIKDFGNFINRGFYVNEEADPLTGHLFLLEAEKWKNLRSKLSPTFTSGKMKMMFHTMMDSTKGLKKLIAQAESNHDHTELKDIISRFTTDIIGSCAFGIECNSMENPDVSFRKIGKRIFENTGVEALRFLVQFLLPNSFLRAINFKTSKPDVEKFCMDLLSKTVNYREKNNIARKDFLHLLIQLKNRGAVSDDNEILNKGKVDNQMTMEELSAQVFVFFAAGFETSSTATTFSLFELARNQEKQDKLREEISKVLYKHNGEYTYETFMEMKYLEQVINEALRMYPPVTILNREAMNNYKVPGTSVTLKKGTKVFIPVLGIHFDEKIYPNPHKFEPERFDDGNNIPSCAFLPFGDGPRNCIGLRFGLLQTKIGLATIVKDYRITLSDKTVLPLKFDAKSIIHMAVTPIYFNLEKI